MLYDIHHNQWFTIWRHGQGDWSMADGSGERGVVDRVGHPDPASGTPKTGEFGQQVTHAWAGIMSLFNAVPTQFLAFVTLWLLAFFPWLRPWVPPEVRSVSISHAAVAERRLTLPGSREVVSVVTFESDVTGYTANPIVVATVWIDAFTQRRVEPELTLHGTLVSTAKTNQSIGWLDVRYPTLPPDVQGCLILRVLLLLAPDNGLDFSQMPRVTEPTEEMPLLAYTDTPPFEPYEDGSCAALPNPVSVEAG